MTTELNDLTPAEMAAIEGVRRAKRGAKWVYAVVTAMQQAAELTAQQAAREGREREREQAQQRASERAQEWANERPAERNKLSDRIRAYLRGPYGRLGEWPESLAEVIPDKDDPAGYGAFPERFQLCLDRLIKARAIRRDAEGKYWDPKAYYHEHPNSKQRSGAVQNIGTVPDAVRFHRQMTPVRLTVAVALSGHLYATRRSWAKGRAIGYRAIAKAAHVNPETAQLALVWLKDQGLLDYAAAVGSRGRVYHWTAKTKVYRKGQS